MRISIIGSGISGLTCAVLLRDKHKDCKIDIYEKRKNEIGGNCFDILNKRSYHQKYGPHIFHTNNTEVWDFLNRFSDFEYYQHKVVSYINGQLQKIPLHENDVSLKEVNISEFNNAQDYLYNYIGEELTKSYFKNYSEKQWGIDFNKLPVDIVKRIPLNKNDEDRYFPNERFQGIPSLGFTTLCKNMLKYSKAKIFYKKINYNNLPESDLIIFTGLIDDFFDYKYGKLKYRYIDFKFKQYDRFDQDYAVVNYPNDYDFTRITKYSNFLKNYSFKSEIIGFEYPSDNEKFEPCYPIFWDIESRQIFEKYNNIDKNILFIGRLASYQYLNIDKAIENVFKVIKNI